MLPKEPREHDPINKKHEHPSCRREPTKRKDRAQREDPTAKEVM
jgi:hypothetical protein